MKKLSVVIPTFNEKDNVEPLANAIDEALGNIPHEIIFVDDSMDETVDVLKQMAESRDNVVVEHRTEGKGLSSAVIRGFEIAGGDYLAVMDADFQHPPILMKLMYEELEKGAQVCLPSRFIPGGSDGGLNWYRKFVSWTARYIGKIMLPCLKGITDPTGGVFAVRKEVVKDAKLEAIGWKILIEVLAMGKYDKNKIVEIPYKFQSRPAGESKLSTKVTLEYLAQIRGLMKRAANR